MIRNKLLASGIIFGILFSMVCLAQASPPKKEGYTHPKPSSSGHPMPHGSSTPKGHAMPHGSSTPKGHAPEKGSPHTFAKFWRHTLSEEQKQKADAMHIALKTESGPLKAKKALKKSELRSLVIQENTNQKALNKKIDEILEIDRELMQLKYSHMVEMRGMLNPEQRLSFDLGVLNPTGH